MTDDTPKFQTECAVVVTDIQSSVTYAGDAKVVRIHYKRPSLLKRFLAMIFFKPRPAPIAVSYDFEFVGEVTATWTC